MMSNVENVLPFRGWLVLLICSVGLLLAAPALVHGYPSSAGTSALAGYTSSAGISAVDSYPSSPAPAHPAEEAAESTTFRMSLEGQVLDSRTNEPVPYVYMRTDEINRAATTDRNGAFLLENLPAGTYTLALHRIGYVTQRRLLVINEQTSPFLEITLQPAALSGEAIEVVASQDQLRGAAMPNASIRMSGQALRDNLGTTVAETMANEPGFAQRTMGANPARPVIRGLGDSRVLMLQDGERTGDASDVPPDHAVTIDPISADQIEVARGPAALAYGSSAIGGVVNVVRNQIPTSRPASRTGSASLHGFSVNNGVAAATSLRAPWRDTYAVHFDLNGRYSADYATPAGMLDNSFLRATNSAAGISYIQPWGYTGVAVSTYLSHYGIPPDAEGGHPSGVDLDMMKFQIESRSEILLPESFVNLLEVRLSYRYYNHKEYEIPGIIGTEFNANTVYATLSGRHRAIGPFREGTIGFWGEWQDYFIFDRFNLEARRYSGSLYTIQQAGTDRLDLQLGLRVDLNLAAPLKEEPDSRIGHIRRRSFAGISSSASLVYDLGAGFEAGTSYMHSFRPPELKELFSRGPHLAAYAFEIGNPDLEPERALGVDGFVKYSHSRIWAQFTVYRNEFRRFIYPRNTGRRNIIIADLNDYQFVSVPARFTGVEWSGEWRLTKRLTLRGAFDYIFAERDVAADEAEITGFTGRTAPLPMIPPASLSAGLSYERNAFGTGMFVRHSVEQSRVGEFEQPTDAFTILDAHMQYRFMQGPMLHTVSLRVDNLLNHIHFNHLSRIKEVYPEPGRSFNLLYRLYF